MNNPQDELLVIADREAALAAAFDDLSVRAPLEAIEDAANRIGKAWSGSWLGYQSCVYYDGLRSPPAGAHFSSEWVFENLGWIDGATTGDWSEFAVDQVKAAISTLSHDPDLKPAHDLVAKVSRQFDKDRGEVASILSTELSNARDSYVESLKEELDKLRLLSKAGVLSVMRPSGQIMSRDSLAITQGLRTPPHIDALAEVFALRQAKQACEQLSVLARKAGSHIGRKSRRQRAATIGTNIFIGHGRSLLWRELKDFVENRLRLPSDEFNRVPVAGVTNTARLSEMLDAAAIAFLVLTGEDEMNDGTLQARMNVVHEAGLFQGKLGFTKAIILLEEGCEEFSNIQGLGQIRFPQGKIKAAFEDVRAVLEREGILTPS